MAAEFLAVVGLGKDLRTALDRAYGRIEHIDLRYAIPYRYWSESFQIKKKCFEYSNSISNTVTVF